MKKTNAAIDKKIIIINSASGILHKVLSAGLLVWLYQYLVKRVDAEEYMLLPVVTALMMFAPLVTTMLTGSIGRFVMEAHAQRKNQYVTTIISTMFPVMVGAFLLISIIGILAIWQVHNILDISPIYHVDSRLMLAALLFGVVIKIILAPFGVGFWVFQKFYLSNIVNLIFLIIRIYLLLTLFKYFGTEIKYAVYTSVFAEVGSTIVISGISYRMMPSLRFKPSCIDWSILKKIFSFSSWNVMMQIASTVREAADVIILNKLSTPVQVTTFHFGQLPDKQIRQFMLTATGPVMPSLTALHATEQKNRLSNAFIRVGRYSLFCVLFVATPLIIYAEPLYRLYLKERFDEYSTVPIVMTLLLLSYPLAYANSMTYKLAYATGKMNATAITTLLGATLSVLLSLILVGVFHLGAIGSALSSFIVSILTIIFMLSFIGLKLANLSFKRWLNHLLLPGIIPALIAGIGWFSISKYVVINNWSILIVCGICGGIIYLLTVLLLLDESEKMLINRVRNAMNIKLPNR